MLPVLEAIIGPSSRLTQILLSDSSEFLQVISCLHTQFIYMTALPPHHDHLAQIVATLRKLHQTLSGCCGSSWGTSVDGDVQVGMIGWRSIEVGAKTIHAFRILICFTRIGLCACLYGRACANYQSLKGTQQTRDSVYYLEPQTVKVLRHRK